MLPMASMWPLLLLLTTPGPAAAPASSATLAGAWSGWQQALALHGRASVELDPADLATIAAGEVARHRSHLDGIDRVVGATWSALPRDALWVAILDDTCDQLVSGLTERHLPPELPGQKILFQHVDLPWPFADRQWILDIRNNRPLYAATGGGAWERGWTLADRQEQRRTQVPHPTLPAADAVWTPLNEGGWLLLDAAGGTLLVYHARADVGGAIPDDVATRFALATLRGMMRHVVQRAEQIPTHYDAAHAPLERPDGSVVPPW